MTESKDCKNTRRPLYQATRTILLAAVGAAALARDEMKAMIDRSVERGELADTEARKLMREMLDKREKMMQEHKERARDSAVNSESATHADVEALSARVAELTHQIEELKKEKSA